MKKFKILALVFTIFSALSACSSSTSTSTTPVNSGNLGALSCSGARTWDFGASDVLQGAQSLVSESSGEALGNTKFPCTILWEYSPSLNCSLGFTYEDFLAEFGIDDVVQEVGTSGDNLVVVGTDASRQTGIPANISVIDLFNLPDCEIQ